MFSKYVTIIVCLFFLTLHTFGFPDPTVVRLDNGVTLVTVEDPSATIASSFVFVRTGSLFESPWIGAGVSHFLEHLVAGGTTKVRSEDQYRQLIDQLGGVSNAYTTFDHTAYFIKSSTENAPKAIRALFEWVSAADWTMDEFVREQGVVLKEMARSDSNVRRQIYYNIQSRYYKDSPYRYPVIGYRDRFLQISSTDLMDYYKSTYKPENFIVVVGGNIHHDEILKQVQDTFGLLPKLAAPLRYHANQNRILSPAVETILLPEVSSNRVVIRYPIPSFFHQDVYPLDLFAYILGTGQQSLMYKEFVTSKKIATAIAVNSITPSHDFGYFEVSLETNKDPATIVNHVQQFIDRYQWARLANQQLDKARRQKQNEYILSKSNLHDHMREIGQAMIMGQDPLFFQYYSKNFSDVSANDINQVTRKYLSPTKRQVYLITNKVASSKVVKKSQALTPVIEVENGITYIQSPESNQDIVRVTINLDGGIDLNPSGKEGLGYLSARLIGKQTSQLSRAEFQMAFESKGAQVSAAANHNSLSYSLLTTNDDVAKLLPLFLSGLTQMTLDDALFAEAKDQLLKSISKKQESWFEEAFDALKSQLFQTESPFYHPLKGTTESISGLTKSDVQAYIDNRLAESKITVIIQSKNPSDIKRKLTQSLASKVNNPNNVTPVFSKMKLKKHALKQPVGVVLRVDQLKQPIQTTKKWLEIKLVDALLSGMRYPSGLLHSRLRGSQLVYVVHTLPIQFGNEDMLFTYALTEPHQVQSVWQIIDQSFKEIRTQITEDQLSLAKAQVLFDLQMSLQDPSSKSRLLVELRDRFNRFPTEAEITNEINGISIQDIKEVVNESFNKPYIALFNKDKTKTDDNISHVR
ncbi:MAG: M16 family metallopeptidase [Candidatus Marinamargulisbacteria bacterium]